MTKQTELCCCGHPKAGHQYNTEAYPYHWECTAVIYIDNYRYSCQCNEIRSEVSSEGDPDFICIHLDDDRPRNFYGTSNPPKDMDWNFRYCPKCGEEL